MLLPNETVWATRTQSIDALLTAPSETGGEVYYLATVCQVGLHPPLLSISPNPEYPICAAIEGAGRFAVSFLREDQGALVERCKTLGPDEPDKIARLGVPFERTEGGTPVLASCRHHVECEVERAWMSGDHLTIVGRVVSPGDVDLGQGGPHRFGGRLTGAPLQVKRVLCLTGVYGLLQWMRQRRGGVVSIEDGTRQYMPGSAVDDGTGAERRTGETMETKTVARPPGICLVGCGWWGEVHALSLKELGPRVRRFFASRDPADARAFADRFDGEAAFSSYGEALADDRVDAVILALPHHLHAAKAREALEAGVHVLVEKPIALSVEEAEELVAIAAEAQLCLAVAEQYRLSPAVAKARELIRTGKLGRVTLVRAGAVGSYQPAQGWKRSQEQMGGGVLMDVGIHYVDILRFWFGEPELVWATAPPHLKEGFEPEDAAVAVFRFPDGPVALLHISWSGRASPDTPNFEVIGSDAALELRLGEGRLDLTTSLPSDHWAERVRQTVPWRLRNLARPALSRLPRASREAVVSATKDPIGSRALIEDFVEAIALGRPAAVPGSEALRDLHIVLGAYRALQEGQPISLDDEPSG